MHITSIKSFFKNIKKLIKLCIKGRGRSICSLIFDKLCVGQISEQKKLQVLSFTFNLTFLEITVYEINSSSKKFYSNNKKTVEMNRGKILNAGVRSSNKLIIFDLYE